MADGNEPPEHPSDQALAAGGSPMASILRPLRFSARSFMRISVVIPSFNHSKYIESAVQSVFMQASDELEVELIIIDDGSSDDSLEIIRECLKSSPLERTILIEQENRGAHAAIMRGIEHARGDFIAILNSDDAFLPGRFAAMAEKLDPSQDGIAFTLVEMIDENDQPLPPDSPQYGWYQDVLASAAACPTHGFALLRNNPAVTSGNFLFSRSLYDKLGGFSEHQLSHDWDFLLRSTFYVEPVFIPETLMRYRVHPENTTGHVQHLMAEEGRDGLNRFMSLARSAASPNPIAPLPANWPRYWPWFCDSIRPHFSDQPIIHSIEPDLLGTRNSDPNMTGRTFDPVASVSRPAARERHEDPRIREERLMSRPSPTTDGMDLNHPARADKATSPDASLRGMVRRLAPRPLRQLAKRLLATPAPPLQNPGPTCSPEEINVDPARPLVLMVTHETSRTGAPLLALDLVRRMSKHAQCAVIHDGEGPLLDDFAKHAWIIDGKQLNPWGAPTSYGQKIMDKLSVASQRMALCNTATTWHYARWIRRFGWRTISLVHDFATNSPAEDYRLIAQSPDVVVYPCETMRQIACEWAGLPSDHGLVHPQGLLRETFLDGQHDAARHALRRSLDLPDESIIVLGCGSLELRKGPELFLLTALSALRRTHDPRLHFVWIGSGADTYLDPTFWCVRDVRRAGVEDRVHFLGEVNDTEEAFRASDMYLLTSREDPFPCVVHEAMACGMPVACFDGSGGSPSMLGDGGGAIIPFGDVQGMADVVIKWLDDPEERVSIGHEGKRIVRDKYSQDGYVKWLMELGLK